MESLSSSSASPSLDISLLSPTSTLFNLEPSALDDMSETQQFLKLEDLHAPSPPSSQHTGSFSQTSPAPVIVHSRPAKKRKSWGQELPEPKTTLPPRKRAKTDDEKEQRRIERIKRNRAAAHNSRERKRHETETLAVALARAHAELEAYRNLHGPLPASIVLPEVTLSTDSAETPAPSLIDSHGSERASSPVSPTDSHMIYDLTKIKLEPNDNHVSQISFSLPPALENLDVKSTHLPLDLTQHSAVSVERQDESDSFITSHNPRGSVGTALLRPHDPSTSDLFQDCLGGPLDPFAFTNGALDASFNAPLDFSFDDFIHDSAASALAVDGHGAL